MQEKPVLIHIGFPKTGTSFLQDRFFGEFKDVFFSVPKPEIRKNIISPWAFGFNPKNAKETFSKYIKRKERVIVLSSEDLSGFPHYHDFTSKVIAERLQSCLPNGKILIIIREQKRMLKSCYFQYLKNEGSYSIDKYLFPPELRLPSRDNLNYHFIIDYYQKLFGKEHVLALPYEMFEQDPQVFIAKICELISIDSKMFMEKVDFSERINKGYPASLLQIKRYLNPFILQNYPNAGNTFYSTIFHGCWVLLKKIPISVLGTNFEKNVKRKIEVFAKDRYTESNRKTSALIDIDLGKYGYDT
ncbi:MAG TPA: hypothetical protein VFM72_06695 [Aequorivita sp.]|nr:hypothetical protein [Aequorivita sp.]